MTTLYGNYINRTQNVTYEVSKTSEIGNGNDSYSGEKDFQKYRKRYLYK